MKFFQSSMGIALVAGLVAIGIFKVVSVPENLDKIYDTFVAAPVVPKIEEVPVDPDVIKAAQRQEYAQTAASVAPADKAQFDLFVSIARGCVGHMRGEGFDLSQVIEVPFGVDADDLVKNASFSGQIKFPHNIIAHIGHEKVNETKRPTSCWVSINDDLSVAQLAVLRAGTMVVFDDLVAHGFETTVPHSPSEGNVSFGAIFKSNVPKCSRIASMQSKYPPELSLMDMAFSINEMGGGCKAAAKME